MELRTMGIFRWKNDGSLTLATSTSGKAAGEMLGSELVWESIRCNHYHEALDRVQSTTAHSD
jgi:hypothetical protein